MEMNAINIARTWARAFSDDNTLRAWADVHFDKSISIYVGDDMRRSPDTDKAPFIILFPDSSISGPQRAKNTFEIGFVAGVLDENWQNHGGFLEMRGYQRLEELCPILEKCMRMTLPKARVQNVEIEYEIMEFPLMMALGTVTVEESLPVGGR
jgi:hypothetical protein